ncbi:prolyl-tRNA synthetase [Fimicolochytrium jonesii]|uniref:prolyl-tRNA synthetase n=1 Tax=Fimicolochytrium jonesii TaxID=1396493 RepID=UPI0022FED3ED|nr:prolyl-tRNA synthetase [Fimicolochytrium jonesii]KAI8819861.1 prolyl-tRNA synthetase [Fimicolochytrium jonesii]
MNPLHIPVRCIMLKGGAPRTLHRYAPVILRQIGSPRCPATLRQSARALNSNATRFRRNLLSKFLVPTAKSSRGTDSGGQVAASHGLLLRAGLIRQSAAGIYSFLPLGLRILEKLEKLIDREMRSVDGQKVALPCILPSDGWKKTGRWESTGSEMFKLNDRKGSEFCLAPTHEEEITQLVASEITSWKQLPLRLYQIGRKYRDEARPRSGLLRAREFIMKDMYTFDASEDAARRTYEEVRGAYDRILNEIGIPFAAAEADTGNIGGSTSHEYHFLSPAGEDTVLRCSNCGYTANDERASGVINTNRLPAEHLRLRYEEVNSGKHGFARVEVPKGRSVNFIKLKKAAPEGITLGNDTTAHDGDATDSLVFVDKNVPVSEVHSGKSNVIQGDFITIQEGDGCPHCHASTTKPSTTIQHALASSRAIEIGHTFLLGTKYSRALNAMIKDNKNELQPIQMGCYGIGVTRMIAAIVEASRDENGIKWPGSIAPFRVCVIPFLNKKSSTEEMDAIEDGVKALYEGLRGKLDEEDIVVDDRADMSFGFKMKDGLLVGYPHMIILGKKYLQEGLVEVHSRTTGTVEYCKVADIGAFVDR